MKYMFESRPIDGMTWWELQEATWHGALVCDKFVMLKKRVQFINFVTNVVKRSVSYIQMKLNNSATPIAPSKKLN